jgi:SAM-dependent methyltransferase
MAGAWRLVRRFAKGVIRAIPILRRHVLASTDYQVLSGFEQAQQIQMSNSGWFSERAAARQEYAYLQLIKDMRNSEPRIDLRTAADAVVATGLARPHLLEVGCGSGYYFEILNALVPDGISYVGIDYSPAMIARAKLRYPTAVFELGDATKLPYGDGHFPIVFNGVSLTHIIDYHVAIAEAARVASDWCIFNTVPVFSDFQTTILSKYAYGGRVVEIVFDEGDLLEAFRDAGLTVAKTWQSIPYDVHETMGHHSTSKTYLCKVARDGSATTGHSRPHVQKLDTGARSVYRTSSEGLTSDTS